MHIEVVLKPHHASASDAPPTPTLHASNFRLRQQGQSIPFHLTRSGVSLPDHLLLIVPSLSSGCLPLAAQPAVERLGARGWIVSVADASGSLAGPLGPAASAQDACSHATPLGDPLADLAQQPGRRIVVFTSSSSPALVSHAVRLIPEVYAVDGGVSVSTFTGLIVVPAQVPEYAPSSPYTVPCHAFGNTVSPNDLCNVGTTSTSRRSGYRHGVLHEESLAGALRTILSSSARYYDLSFQAAAGTPLDLTFHSSAGFSVAVDLYSQQTSAAGLSSRTEPPDTELHLDQR